MVLNANDIPNEENDNSEDSVTYQSREEYLEKLQQWLDEARLWHGFCAGFPYYVNLQNQVENLVQFNPWNSIYPTRPLVNNNVTNQNNVPVFQPGTYEFVIPPLWKRVAAEFVDFLILLFIKMILTFLVLESFYAVSVDNYRLDSFKKTLQDPRVAMQMSVEILTLEILHRFIVCCYEVFQFFETAEVYWLKGGTCATPGKRYMGLMVIKVDTVLPVPGRSDDVVRASHCAPLGLQKAIIRTVVKNIFLGIMLPMFTLYIFRYNRTGYDAISNSLVVEHNPNTQFHQV